MKLNHQGEYRIGVGFLLLGVIIATAALLVDVCGIGDPGIGDRQWLALCAAGVLAVVGIAMILPALPDL